MYVCMSYVLKNNCRLNQKILTLAPTPVFFLFQYVWGFSDKMTNFRGMEIIVDIVWGSLENWTFS